jgi:hypothetical protein
VLGLLTQIIDLLTTCRDYPSHISLIAWQNQPIASDDLPPVPFA